MNLYNLVFRMAFLIVRYYNRVFRMVFLIVPYKMATDGGGGADIRICISIRIISILVGCGIYKMATDGGGQGVVAEVEFPTWIQFFD